MTRSPSETRTAAAVAAGVARIGEQELESETCFSIGLDTCLHTVQPAQVALPFLAALTSNRRAGRRPSKTKQKRSTNLVGCPNQTRPMPMFNGGKWKAETFSSPFGWLSGWGPPRGSAQPPGNARANLPVAHRAISAFLQGQRETARGPRVPGPADTAKPSSNIQGHRPSDVACCVLPNEQATPAQQSSTMNKTDPTAHR